MGVFTKFGARLLLALVLLCSCSIGYESDIDYSLMPVKQGDKWGYINVKGEYIINPQFDGANVFTDNGLARVWVGDKCGFINKKGEYVIAPQYSSATEFFAGKAWTVKPKGAPVLIDTKGRSCFTLKNVRTVYNYSGGLAVVVDDNEMFRAINTAGETVFELSGPAFVTNFVDGLAAVQNMDRLFGYVDKNGKAVINSQFYGADFFLNGKAIVRADDMYGVVNKEGKYVINPQFAEMQQDYNKFLIKIGEQYGWCDERGKIIINPQFENAFPFFGANLAAIKMGEQWGYVNKEGKITVNPQFQFALPFIGKVAWVKSADKWGLIDEDGKFVVNPQFNDVLCSYRLFIPVRNYVVSEYFNVEGIISWINMMLDGNKVDGMTVTQTTISGFRKKYNLGEKGVSVEKKYSRDMSYEIYANGTFYENVSDGWWGTTTKQLPNARLDYVTIQLKLKDNENTRPLYDAVINALGGNNGKRGSGQYVKVKASPGIVTIYVSDKQIKDILNDNLGWSNY